MYSDVTPPSITCPDDLTLPTEPDINTAEVFWYLPNVTDNSNGIFQVTVSPIVVPPTTLPVGRHTLTYTATDQEKNTADCHLVIVVEGK